MNSLCYYPKKRLTNYINIKQMKHLIIALLFLPMISFAQETEEQIKKTITHEWLTYSKAFELKDYNKIAEFFHYPVILSGKSYSSKKTVMETYKERREKKVQPGYKYSLSDEIKFIKISNELVIAEFYYSRYNAKYEKLFSGSSIGTYKKLDGKWKMSEYQSGGDKVFFRK